MATISWKSNASGDWNTPANWTGNVLPGASDAAAIATASAQTISISGGADYVAGLTIAATDLLAVSYGTLNDSGTATLAGGLQVSGGTVVLGGASQNTGALTLSAGTLAFGRSSATLTQSGAMTLSGGDLAGPGTLTTTGTTTVSATSYIDEGLTWSNTGTVLDAAAIYADANIYTRVLSNSVANQASGVFDFTSDGFTAFHDYNPTPTVFSNAGLLEKTAGTGTLAFEAVLNSTGMVAVTSGTLALDGGGTVDGTLNVATGATLALGGGAFTLTGALSTTGALAVSGGTLGLGGTARTIGNTVVLSGGTVAIGAGQTLTLSGPVNWSGSDVAGPGTLATTGTTTVAGAGASIGNGLVWTNSGTVLVNAAGALQAGGTPTSTVANQTGGVFDFTLDGQAFSNGAVFTNAGLLEKTGGTGTFAFDAALTSTGTITATRGILELDNGGTLNGVIGGSGPGIVQLGVGSFVTTGTLAVLNAGTDTDMRTTRGTWTDSGVINDNGRVLVGNGETLNIVAAGRFNLVGDSAALAESDLYNCTLINAGIIAKTGGSGRSVISENFFTNFGTVDAASGTLDIFSNPLRNPLGGTGVLKIEASATLELYGGYIVNSNTLDFNGAGATLKLDHLSGVSNPIIGLGAGSRIDLASAPSATATATATISGNTLTIKPVGFGANVDFTSTGSLAGLTATTASDGAGGTIVTLSPAPAPRVAQASGQTIAWAANVSGEWTTPSNWVGGVVPGTADTASIATASPQTITLAGVEAVAGLITATNDKLAVSAGTLTVSGTVTVAGGLTVSGGTVGFGATTQSIGGATVLSGGTLSLATGHALTLPGAVTWNGTDVVGAGTLVTTGTTSISSPAYADGGLTWVNSGTALVSSMINFEAVVRVATTIINQPTGVFDLTSNQYASYNVFGYATFVNYGLIEKTGATQVIGFDAALNNAGTISVSSGTLNLIGTTTLGGSVTLGSTSTLQLSSYSNTFLGAVITGGTLLLTGSVALGVNSQNVGSAVAIASGNIAFGSGQTLTLAGAVTWTGNNPSGDSVSGTGTLVTAGTMTISATARFDNGATWINSGTVLVNSFIDIDSGQPNDQLTTSIINQSTGVFDFTSDDYKVFRDIYSSTHVTFSNAGLVEKTGSTGLLDWAAPVNSTGTIAVSAGTLQFDQGGTLHGTISIAAASVLSLSHGAYTLSDVHLTGGSLYTLGATTIDNIYLNGPLTWINSVGVADEGNIFVDADQPSNNSAITIVNQSFATFNFLADGFSAFNRYSAAQLVFSNAGVLEKTVGADAVYFTATLDSTGNVTATSGTLELDDGGTLDGRIGGSGAGVVQLGGGSFVTHGTLAILDAHLNNDLTIADGATWTDIGTINAGGRLLIGNGSAGSLVIGAGGHYNLATDDAALAAGSFGTLTNAGVIAKTGGGGTSAITIGVRNAGTVDAASGTLRLGNSMGGSGQLRIEAGATLELLGGVNAGVNTLDFAGTGATLRLDSNSAPTQPILGLGFGDTIDLRAAASATAMVNGGTLTITPAGGTALIFVSATGLDGLRATTAGDGAGGTLVTLTSLYTLTTGPDTVNATSANDSIIATNGVLSAGDQIDGGGGTNTLVLQGGGTFNEAAPATLVNMQVVQAQEGAGAAAQTLTLRNGLDQTVNVASGDQGALITINAGVNNSTIALGSGTDTVTLGSSGQHVMGGGGADRFNVTAASIGATIDGGTGASILGVSGGGTLATGANITRIATVVLGGTTPYSFTANGVAGLLIDAGDQPSTITLGAASQSVNAQGGAIRVLATAATASAKIVGAPNAVLEITGGGTATLNQATTSVTVQLDQATNLSLGSATFVTAMGSTGADTITAQAANQTLTGGAGADTLVGAAGGSDVFLDSTAGLNGDTIGNWTTGDRLDLTDMAFASVQPLMYRSGTLTVTDGSDTAAIGFTGALATSNFTVLGNDGHGGTLIGWHA